MNQASDDLAVEKARLRTRLVHHLHMRVLRLKLVHALPHPHVHHSCSPTPRLPAPPPPLPCLCPPRVRTLPLAEPHIHRRLLLLHLLMLLLLLLLPPTAAALVASSRCGAEPAGPLRLHPLHHPTWPHRHHPLHPRIPDLKRRRCTQPRPPAPPPHGSASLCQPQGTVEVRSNGVRQSSRGLGGDGADSVCEAVVVSRDVREGAHEGA
ncbi:unnamed protein product [Closterium sp. NIES-54]